MTAPISLKVAPVPEPRDPAPVYPLPATDDDPRFTFGLVHDVADVLLRHGYPRLASGSDWVELQQSIFRFLYVPRSRYRPVDDP